MPADPWLIISSVGFVVSLALWFGLLRKFRQAGQPEFALDLGSVSEPILPVPVRRSDSQASSTLSPVKSPEIEATVKAIPPLTASEATMKVNPSVMSEPIPTPAPAPVSAPVPAPQAFPEPSPAKPILPGSPAPVPNLKSGQTLTGGISPAVVYLQNLKEQLEGLRKEVQAVKTQVSGVSQKNESQWNEVLLRLDEIRAATANGSGAPAPQAQSAAAPSLSPNPTPTVEPAPYNPPAFSLELPSGEPTPQQSAPGAEPTPPAAEPKKGPVWPS